MKFTYCGCPFITDEKTEALTDEMTCPGDSAVGETGSFQHLCPLSALMGAWASHFAFLAALTYKIIQNQVC